MEVGDLHVGKQLQVVSNLPGGTPGPPNVAHGVGPTAVPGAVWADGGLHVGSPLFTVGETCVGFARPPLTNSKATAKSILTVTSRGFTPNPLDIMLGDPTGHVGITVNSLSITIFNDTNITINSPNTNGTGVLTWTGAKTLTGAESLTGTKAHSGSEARSSAKVFNGNVIINGQLTCNNVSLIGTINVQGWKEFDIPHPTKPNHRLSHACIEGPEIGVYYRGKLKDKTIIELPEYWMGLVDAESITVNLTPHGCYQELFVKSIEWGTRIIIQNNSGGPIDCSYVVYGKRKDVPDLEVEYIGTEMKGGK